MAQGGAGKLLAPRPVIVRFAGGAFLGDIARELASGSEVLRYIRLFKQIHLRGGRAAAAGRLALRAMATFAYTDANPA
jgi:hypothetical protein